MKTARHLLYVLLAISTSCSVMTAQPASSSTQPVVPRLVNFSGMATDAQGETITGIGGATFAIYKDQYGGSPLWLETQNIQIDAKGNYTVQLGATKPGGLPLDLFSSGEARWLGITINGGQEQPRVLLLSVPYALKAADAETIGGLPPSAFVLAIPDGTGAGVPSSQSPTSATAPPPATSNVTTTGGTVNGIPLWTTGTNIQTANITQTGSGATAKIGINTSAPASRLDVNGAEIVRGNLSLPATGVATATTGKNSQPTTLTASVFNSGTGVAVPQNFRWQAEPSGNNTSRAGGTLNLLFGTGSNPLGETGLKISTTGLFTFATGQTFPGTGPGTVTSVGLSAPASDFLVTGSPVTKSGTLALNWNVAPTIADTANAIVKRDPSGNFSATSITATGQLFATAFSGNGNAIEASSAASNATVIYGGASSTTGPTWAVEGETFSNDPGAYGVFGRNYSAGIGVVGQNTANGIGVFGTAPNGFGFVTDSNAQQARTAGGWVKAMALVSPAGIAACFNSAIPGSAATTPPCGFTFIYNVAGVHIIDFGFKVDDRFLSIASADGTTYYSRKIYQTCTDLRGQCYSSLNENQVEVSTYDFVAVGYLDGTFYLIVY